MHIEAHYGHRWSNGRRPDNSGNFQSDAVVRPSRWSSTSVRNKSRRQTITQSQTLQTHTLKGSAEYTQSPVKHYSSAYSSMHNFSGVNPITTTRSMDREVLYDGSRRTKSANLNGSVTTSPHSCISKYSKFFVDHECTTNASSQGHGGPKPLPPHIVNKLQEKFDKRVLRHCMSVNNSSSSGYTSSNVCKYQLIAAFLVNGGAVEAWHIYAPMPVDMGRPQEKTVGTRTLELTQRRLRLLQRYYSGARQYVILYVNSSFAEHYLPMGLATDPRANSLEIHGKSIPHRPSTHSELARESHGIVSRMFSSIPFPSRACKSDENMAHETMRESSQTHRCTTITSPQRWRKMLRRDLSLPQLQSEKVPQFSPSSFVFSQAPASIETKPPILLSHAHSRQTFMQRLLVHFWSKYGRPKDTKSASLSRSSGKTHNDIKVDVEEPHEKDSTSSGLINFSSTTGSSTSDNHMACSEQVEDELEERRGMSSLHEPTKDSSAQTANVPEADVCASIRSEVWLPKNR
ncbi:hypothetical protein PHET_01127 [Paragonimus heterotremus]|uniref:Uncharacterized protein n=1 Tax=Paragonimus heterotremus TaxID=100268 RepID=A0A8J4TMS2_9TREM|nr:hypothetical protein PHET_01127 [Paragonimus heterotremus]